jgi:predicted RNase H-like HicB family nuclease
MIDQEIIRVKAIWDNEARVWVATSDDVPGLITESENLEDLVQKLKILIPELLEANGSISKFKSTEITFHLFSERSEIASCKGL